MLEQQLKSIPIGVASWSVMRDNNLLYVDKTAKLGVLVSKHQKVFLSRPRRMGKSLLCSMLKDLFTNGDTNFSNSRNVIRVIYPHILPARLESVLEFSHK